MEKMDIINTLEEIERDLNTLENYLIHSDLNEQEKMDLLTIKKMIKRLLD